MRPDNWNQAHDDDEKSRILGLVFAARIVGSRWKCPRRFWEAQRFSLPLPLTCRNKRYISLGGGRRSWLEKSVPKKVLQQK